MDADGLSRYRYRPIRVGLGNTVDRFVLDIDELVLRRIIRLDTEDLTIRVLYAGTGRGADPIIQAYHHRIVGDSVAIGRPSQIRSRAGRLVVFRDLTSV
jgi:hypothetical protein